MGTADSYWVGVEKNKYLNKGSISTLEMSWVRDIYNCIVLLLRESLDALYGSYSGEWTSWLLNVYKKKPDIH